VVSNSGEVELPDLVRADRLLGERRLPALGQFAALALVLITQYQAAVTPAQHRGLGDHVPIVADHRPDLAVSPHRMVQRVLVDQLRSCLTGRSWPPALQNTRQNNLGFQV